MSSSAKRNGRGRMQIEAIHERLTKSPDIRTRAVAAAMTIHTAIQDDKSHKKVDSWCQTEPVTTPRDRRLLDAAPVEQRVAPESLDGYVLPGSPCFRKLKPAEQPHELVMKFHLVVGSPVSETLVAELRRLMPNLPPDIFYVSSALRLALFHELVRFYAAVEMQATANNTRVSPQAKRVFEGEGQIQDAEVVIGSPRDTPFLRRKALETIKSKTRQRNSRHLFTSGGVAILQTAFTSTSQHSPR